MDDQLINLLSNCPKNHDHGLMYIRYENYIVIVIIGIANHRRIMLYSIDYSLDWYLSDKNAGSRVTRYPRIKTNLTDEDYTLLTKALAYYIDEIDNRLYVVSGSDNFYQIIDLF